MPRSANTIRLILGGKNEYAALVRHNSADAKPYDQTLWSDFIAGPTSKLL